MSATLTPLARHARLRQVPASPLPAEPPLFAGTEADDASTLPWGRTSGVRPFQPLSDAELRHMGVDADGVRRSYLATQYAAGFEDGQDVGERKGTLRGWYWGAACGAFATALVALVAGIAIAKWATQDADALPASTGKAATISAPAAPHWSSRS